MIYLDIAQNMMPNVKKNTRIIARGCAEENLVIENANIGMKCLIFKHVKNNFKKKGTHLFFM